jgi:hypothetical protein
MGKPEEKRPQGRTKVGGWIILRWIWERQEGVAWIALIWLRIGQVNVVMNHWVP